MVDKSKWLEGENYELKGKFDVVSKDINKWENKYEDENREKSKIVVLFDNEKGNYGWFKNEYNELKS